jgi:hypothetical protein
MRGLLLLAILALAPAARADVVVTREHPRFTLTLPDGWVEQKAPPGLLCALADGDPSDGKPHVFVNVERLGGLLGRGDNIDLDEAGKAVEHILPGATMKSVMRLSWRSANVFVIVLRAGTPAKETLIYSARLPLAGEAVQLNVGGPAGDESKLASVLAIALSGFDGPVEWAGDARRRRLTLAGGATVIAVALAALLLGVASVRRRGRRPAPN